MEKRLGIDMGTNSLGWALVEMTEEGCVLLDRIIRHSKSATIFEDI